MKYTITEQVSISRLNKNLYECQNIADAKYQIEIYAARETRNKICIVQPFNTKGFTHAVNSTIRIVPGKIINDVILPAHIDCITIKR